MTKKKSWIEKRNCGKEPHIKIIEKTFAGVPAGSKLLISSPIEIDQFIRSIPKKQQIEPQEMRTQLAKRHQADATCPVSTGIFLRIVAEAAVEEYRSGITINNITPFWRVIKQESPLAKKLSIDGEEFNKIKNLAEE